MKIITDIQQGTIEWKNIRHAKIGGSSAKDLLVKELPNSAIFHKICSEMCEDFDEYETSYVSEAMERGNHLEPEARKELEKITGLMFNVPAWIQSDIDILGISPDGIVENLKKAAEFKCPAKNTYNKYMHNNRLLIDEYCAQIATYFAVIPTLTELFMCAYRPEHYYQKMIVISVTRDFVFNNGTEKTPKMYTIGELANDIKVRAVELSELCKQQIETYKF